MLNQPTSSPMIMTMLGLSAATEETTITSEQSRLAANIAKFCFFLTFFQITARHPSRPIPATDRYLVISI